MATATTLRLRLHSAAAHAVGVKGLAPVSIGLVFGLGFSVWPQAENSLQSGNGFGGKSGVLVAGLSGAFIGQFMPIRCSGSWRHGSCWCKVSGVGIRSWVLIQNNG
jgi:hypothetical protein